MSFLRLKRTVAVVALLLMAAALAPGGCGGDDGDGTAATATGPVATAVTADGGPSADEINIYVEQVRELVHIGDQLNADYRDLVDRFNSGDAAEEEVITVDGQNAATYTDMVSQLERMTVPAGMEESHDMILDGFGKWERMYQLDARGLAEKDSGLLDQARALDNEAVAQVNEAIDAINRLKAGE